MNLESTDLAVVVVLEATLVLFTLNAFFRDAVTVFSVREASATVTRGEPSMAALYTVYAAALASNAFIVDAADALDGHRVLVLLVSFVCWTYLFFFSSWFRNRVFFRLLSRVRND